MERSSEILKENYIRPTRLRVQVLNILISSEQSFSSTEMRHYFEEVQDRVTIYRILNLLYEAGILERTVDTDGAIRYFYCAKNTTLSPSFRCLSCGMIAQLSPLPDFYQYELGKYQVDRAVLLFSGICEGCKNKELT